MHMKVVDTLNVSGRCGGETVLIGKGQHGLPGGKGEQQGKRDHTSAQSWTFRLSSSHVSEHVDGPPAEYMNLPSDRICVAILREARAGVLHAMSLGSCTE